MKILQFIPSFHQGGTERQAVALTRALYQEGTLDVFVATLNKEGVLLGDFERNGVAEILEFPLTSFYNANFARQVRGCAALLRQNQIDIVHTHDFYTNIFGMAAATLASTPVKIASKRETAAMRSRGQDFIEKLAFGRADAIVANSAAVRKHLENSGIASAKIEVIHNGIDPERFSAGTGNRQEVCRAFGLSHDDGLKFVTMVANLRHPVKNVPMLLHVARFIVETQPKVHFVIAGEGELEAELKHLAKGLGVAENVHFIGRCTDVPALLSISYACVLTSTAEGFSNSILEYMAAGRPVVATNVGGAAEAIVDGETGYLVDPNDEKTMADRLFFLIEAEQEAAEMGGRGKRRVRDTFSSNAQIEKTLRLYGRGAEVAALATA